MIKIEILFCRGGHYIGGGKEPLIATVEGSTDSGRQSILENLGTGKKVGEQNERRMERGLVGVKVVLQTRQEPRTINSFIYNNQTRGFNPRFSANYLHTDEEADRKG